MSVTQFVTLGCVLYQNSIEASSKFSSRILITRASHKPDFTQSKQHAGWNTPPALTVTNQHDSSHADLGTFLQLHTSCYYHAVLYHLACRVRITM